MSPQQSRSNDEQKPVKHGNIKALRASHAAQAGGRVPPNTEKQQKRQKNTCFELDTTAQQKCVQQNETKDTSHLA